MKIIAKQITYNFESRLYSHHVLVLISSKKVLLSPVNLFIREKCINSVATSKKYANALKRFLTYVITKHCSNRLNYNLWREVTSEDIREWQNQQVQIRDTKGTQKPSNKTIFENAKIVYNFYAWANKKAFPVLVNSMDVSWKYNFREGTKRVQRISMLSGTAADTANIETGIRTSGSSRNKSAKIVIMTNENIRTLMHQYNDPVYPALLILALATGMRSEGCVSMPYIGKGENAHIRTYPNILSQLNDGKNTTTFPFSVKEKGRKKRTVEVNMNAWKVISTFFEPFFFKRKKLFKAKFPDKSSNENFFLKKNGVPVTTKDISDQTYHAKKNIKNFDWSFHSARDWYATNFIIKHLANSRINKASYDAAVEEQLRKQLGHEDIRTTYMHYVRQASLVIALEENQLDYTLGHDTLFFGNLLSD